MQLFNLAQMNKLLFNVSFYYVRLSLLTTQVHFCIKPINKHSLELQKKIFFFVDLRVNRNTTVLIDLL